MRIARHLILLSAALLGAPALAQTMSPADGAMMEGMQTMQHDMEAAPMTGDADQDFVAMMIPHHQGAVAMARTELKYGKDPELRKLAASIIAAQDQEIAEMKRWQEAHPAK